MKCAFTYAWTSSFMYTSLWRRVHQPHQGAYTSTMTGLSAESAEAMAASNGSQSRPGAASPPSRRGGPSCATAVGRTSAPTRAASNSVRKRFM